VALELRHGVRPFGLTQTQKAGLDKAVAAARAEAPK
jgi:hypothetical protein